MNFSELLAKLQKLTPEQLNTEVFCYEEGRPVFWPSGITFDHDKPVLDGTTDLGNTE